MNKTRRETKISVESDGCSETRTMTEKGG